MIPPDINPWFEMAADIVQYTGQNLFLTGKAGTGKTTFLKHIREKTHKKTVVVAPTGVAAINAGGVTMHSFFQLPFQPYLADKAMFGTLDHDGNTRGNWMDRRSLIHNLRIGAEKSTLINNLELLIIDEVSMVRADMLDAMHDILCHERNNKKPFGGVQVVFIGDLYQLPPVVQDHEVALLQEFYDSPFFFSARVLKDNQPLYIELQKVYRQSEAELINLLNNIRNNTLSTEDYDLLNARHLSTPEIPEDDIITLTTHNWKADEINKRELSKLDGEGMVYVGELKGNFSEKSLPAEKDLHLKVGAQVMFTKNDTNGLRRYYNGKIAHIQSISKEGISVTFKDGEPDLVIEKEKWSTVEYVFNRANNSIEENETGSYTQYPLRLAWAVTIHKSQGLTFDQAIIDAGQSFASGQVYVALSRCRTYNGIYLSSLIKPGAIKTDERVVEFSSRFTDLDDLRTIVEREKYAYAARQLMHMFNFTKVVVELKNLDMITRSKDTSVFDEIKTQVKTALVSARELEGIADKLIAELDKRLEKVSIDTEWLNQKIPAGKVYFIKRIQDEILTPLSQITSHLTGVNRVKQYIKIVQDTELTALNKAKEMYGAHYLENAFDIDLPAPRPLKKEVIKPAKGLTKNLTLELYKKGMSVADIAKKRDMAESTIIGHLAESLPSGDINIHDFVSADLLAQIKTQADMLGHGAMAPIKAAIEAEVTFGQIKMALAYFKTKTDS